MGDLENISAAWRCDLGTARTIARAAVHRVKFHEEKDLFGLSRFTAILPDTRLVSRVIYQRRELALASVCSALAPYLDQLDSAAALQNELTKDAPAPSLPA